MKRLLLAFLLFPLSALASGPFTGNHPEESLPDNTQQVSSDPYQPLVRQVQERLHQLGFDAGPVNGEFGAKTQAALAQFQLSLSIPAGGQLDGQTLSELGIEQAAPAMSESASAASDSEPTTIVSPSAGGSAEPGTEQ
jgi:peptidoglycan hydrolase-like protein with peptidoglycan-binding domain